MKFASIAFNYLLYFETFLNVFFWGIPGILAPEFPLEHSFSNKAQGDEHVKDIFWMQNISMCFIGLGLIAFFVLFQLRSSNVKTKDEATFAKNILKNYLMAAIGYDIIHLLVTIGYGFTNKRLVAIILREMAYFEAGFALLGLLMKIILVITYEELYEEHVEKSEKLK